ncbi:MAG: hypothetical protein ILO10_04185, partial [Kiritimatiellae bacterium]|nr:hypothetical protein [Kiritimatiellia bacterium]
RFTRWLARAAAGRAVAAAAWALGLSGAATAQAAAFGAVRPFSEYQVILDRAPFGELTKPEEETERVVPLQESFAAQMALVGIFEDKSEEGMLEVAIVDHKDNQYFKLKIGETDPNGVTLLEADYEMDEAMLKKGDQVVVLSMRTGTTGQVLSEKDRETRQGEMEKKRLSYAERRRLRQEARKRPRELPQPLYTGKELEQKLQESQMESIRKGMPPLPVTLTPENDAQLVAEGFLPPLDEEGYELMDNGYYGPDGMYYEDDGYEEPYEGDY